MQNDTLDKIIEYKLLKKKVKIFLVILKHVDNDCSIKF